MGNTQPSIIYSVECSQKQQGETAVMRSPMGKDGLKPSPYPDILTMQDAWLHSVKHNGTLMSLFTKNPLTNAYEGKTYNEIHQLAREIGSAILHENLTNTVSEDPRFQSMKMIGIFAKNCEEWTILDIANMLYGNVTIPLYDTLGPQNITYCLKHSGITTCFASSASVTQLAKTPDIGNLKNVVVIGEAKHEDKQILASKGLRILSWSLLVQLGKQHMKEIVSVKNTDCLSFSYTSGTTGDPKAAMMSHQNFVAILSALHYHPHVKIFPSDIHLSYYSGDVQKLKDDLAAVRPTFFISVPRLYNRFYDLITQQFEKATGIKKMLINMALKSKMENIKHAKYTHCLYDSLVFNKTKALFGGRCRFLVTSSAPISREVFDFMRVIACCPMVEGYGQTESTGASFATLFDDPESGHAGGPTISNEFKLVDIPEMNYLSTDKVIFILYFEEDTPK